MWGIGLELATREPLMLIRALLGDCKSSLPDVVPLQTSGNLDLPKEPG
jgi:hypothetical protein